MQVKIPVFNRMYQTDIFLIISFSHSPIFLIAYVVIQTQIWLCILHFAFFSVLVDFKNTKEKEKIKNSYSEECKVGSYHNIITLKIFVLCLVFLRKSPYNNYTFFQ